MKKYVVIIFLAIFIFVVLAPNTYADAGPKNEYWYVVDAAIVGAACLGGYYLIHNLFKKKEKEAVTSIYFEKEHVNMSINRNKMTVQATFEYTNTTDRELNMDLYFPFPNLSDATISDVSIALLCPERINQKKIDLDYEIDYKRILFNYNILPFEKVILEVKYIEKLQNKATYILTTIQKWKRPVSQATFKVSLPLSILSPHFTFEEALVNTESDKDNNMIIYHFALNDLFPNKEFEIYLQ